MYGKINKRRLPLDARTVGIQFTSKSKKKDKDKTQFCHPEQSEGSQRQEGDLSH